MAQTSGNRDEPSMEDILSSIRKIIQTNEIKDGNNFDEQVAEQKNAQPPVTKTPVEEASQSQTIAAKPEPKLVVTPVERSPEQETPASSPKIDISKLGELTDAPAPIAPVEPVSMPNAELEPVPSLAAQVVTSAQEAGVEHVVAALEEELNSPKTEDVVAPKETENPVPALLSRGSGAKVAASFAELTQTLEDRTDKNLEDMTSSMLGPMLQDWLDDNLPSLVERLVREEIERVARGD